MELAAESETKSTKGREFVYMTGFTTEDLQGCFTTDKATAVCNPCWKDVLKARSAWRQAKAFRAYDDAVADKEGLSLDG